MFGPAEGFPFHRSRLAPLSPAGKNPMHHQGMQEASITGIPKTTGVPNRPALGDLADGLTKAWHDLLPFIK